MALRTPQKRELQQIVSPKARDFSQEIMAVKGQSPLAVGIQGIGDVISQAMQRRYQLQQQARANQALAKYINPEAKPDESINSIPTNELIAATGAKTNIEKSNSYDFAGLTGDQKNMIVLNKRTGQTELRPLPQGFSPKSPPPKAGGPGGNFKNEDTLRKEFQAQSKDSQQVFNSSAKALSLANQNNSIGDTALTFALTKGAMGGSGRITQTEIQQFGPQLGGLGDRIQNAVLGLANGKKFYPAIRAQVIDMVKNSVSQENEAHSQRENYYKGLAQQNGLNPSHVIQELRPPAIQAMLRTANGLQSLPAPGQETPMQRKARLLQELNGAQ